MRDVLGPGTQLGYCTNVHAGANLRQTRENLERFAVPVKDEVSRGDPMGLGLWFSARTARELLQRQNLQAFKQWFGDNSFLAYTLNGFPYGDFHDREVKHRVYEPDWTRRERVDYTLDLITIMTELLGEEEEGSISTLPLGWNAAPLDGFSVDAAAKNLLEVARRLEQVKQETGKTIHLDLEPEPGCALGRGYQVAAFFQDYLFAGNDRDSVGEHLRVCHDVCHAAVMFESQQSVLQLYREAGIRIGKVQISSAIQASFREDVHEHEAILNQLKAFREERYLHQTSVMDENGIRFYTDLPEAIAAEGVPTALTHWRVHFHVPIFAGFLDRLGTTQMDIRWLIEHIGEYTDCRHFEVETYAWNVLPPPWQGDDLAVGIARELTWVRDLKDKKERTK
jgi:hypothetical protein